LQTSQPYDYIITGAGCAGLSLAIHIIQSNELAGKKILIVDNAPKNKNDRTWCFWEKENGLFQSIVYKQWDQLWFHANDFSKQLSIQPYQYKLIKGIDFYEYCFTQIKSKSNFTIIQGQVDDIKSDSHGTSVTINGNKFSCHYIFNSILFQKPQLKQNQFWLLQHFKGWFIKTAQPQFDPSVATLMDFRTGQSEGATFFYLLPFSENEALIEYTLFSHQLLQDADYETALNK
jgi:lycopene beta-cyclase